VNSRHDSSLMMPRKFTQKLPVRLSGNQVEISVDKKEPTLGGFSETDVNEPMMRNTGSPSCFAVDQVYASVVFAQDTAERSSLEHILCTVRALLEGPRSRTHLRIGLIEPFC